MTNPLSAHKRLREELFRYYRTPYRLRDEKVQAERDAMLDREGLTWREPWVEPIPDYKLTGTDLATAISNAGGHVDLAEFARAGLIEFPDIFTHQRDSLAASADGRNVVVTAGTGSGKTESFLLPLLDSLLRESESWTGTSPGGTRWWNESGVPFTPQRLQESGRTPAMRALVLYPMNALVEDQLGRLRRALDSKQARSWLDARRGGHRFLLRPVHGYQRRCPALRRRARSVNSSPGSCERRPSASSDGPTIPTSATSSPAPMGRRCGAAGICSILRRTSSSPTTRCSTSCSCASRRNR